MMKIPQVYTLQFQVDLETPPFDIISQIEIATHPKAIFHLQAYFPATFTCSTLSESAFKKLCEDGFITKKGQKVSVDSVLKNVRGVLIKLPKTVQKRTLTRKLRKFGKVFFPECALDPNDEEFLIWSLVMAFHKNIPKHLSIGGKAASILLQT